MSKAKYRILHVDDEADIRVVTIISLELDSAFEVRSVGSGADALATAAEWRPDIVLLDVMMPEMDGLETFGRLRSNEMTSTIPVVFMTARTQRSDRERFEMLGAAGVISKPFDPMALAGEVRRFLD